MRDKISRAVALAVAHAAFARAELDRYVQVFLPAAQQHVEDLQRQPSKEQAGSTFLPSIRSYEALAASIAGHADARLAWHHAVADVDLAIGRVDRDGDSDSRPKRP